MKNFRSLLGLFALLFIGLTACDNDDDIITPDISGGTYTAFLEESTTLKPDVSPTDGMTFKWFDIEKKLLSETLEYTFTPDKTGTFKYIFHATRLEQTAIDTFTVIVKHPTPSVSLNIESFKGFQHGFPVKLEASVFKYDKDTEMTWSLNGEDIGKGKTLDFDAEGTGVFTVTFTARNPSIAISESVTIEKLSYTDNGTLVVNEGWFGHEPGNLNYWMKDSSRFSYRVFKKINPEKNLGVTSQAGVLHDGKVYIMSKQAPQLVVLDAATLKYLNEIDVFTGNKYSYAHHFVGVDANKGFLSSADGVYPVNLTDLSVGDKIEGISAGGIMKLSGGKVFVQGVSGESKKIFVLDANAGTLANTVDISGAVAGLDIDADGNVWVGAGEKLIKINASDLTTQEKTLPEDVTIKNGWVWDAGALTTSKTESAVFFKSGKKLYKYVPADSETAELTAILDLTDMVSNNFYNGGVKAHPTTGNIYVNAVKSGWGNNYKQNGMYVRSSAGANILTYNYGGTEADNSFFYFPADFVFL
ncbi:hypothetical protein FUAX_21180 [Fulvitalea axinellae]|uniref:Bacteroidetes PKD-like domain-containing protein n=1 Tax=Fulvitalea axinellae TaxID=1182444 RepID=A0AAU9D9V5_9BACT|nr:hypothetical protein FUAX_21180 [Fulvitalea axinellae]